ncbi:hypothetical protein CRYUN_Cryun29cG0067500 [Craigia yunnanensis]
MGSDGRSNGLENDSTAIGVVARDCNGKLTAGANKLVKVKSAAVAEALALKEGARLAVERRYNKCCANSAADWVARQLIEMCPPSSLVFILSRDGLPAPSGRIYSVTVHQVAFNMFSS